MNTTTIVGRVAKDLEVIETEEGKKILKLVVAIPRQFKNKDGIYETDFIPVRVGQGSMLDATLEYCQRGDLIAVKGRLQRAEDENLKLVAEKISFLSSKPSEEK